MTTPDPRRTDSPAAPIAGAAGEGAPIASGVDSEDGRTIELTVSDLQADLVEPAGDPDEIGPTIGGIPLRNQLAAARIAHALSNAREAQALIDEAVEVLATVRGLHAETYQLGAAVGALRETADLLARHATAAGQGIPLFDLKNDPSYEEIAIWVSFGIPVTS